MARSCQKGSEPPEVLSFRLIIKAKFNPCLCRYIKASPSVCSLLVTNSNALYKSQPGEKCRVPNRDWQNKGIFCFLGTCSPAVLYFLWAFFQQRNIYFSYRVKFPLKKFSGFSSLFITCFLWKNLAYHCLGKNHQLSCS